MGGIRKHRRGSRHRTRLLVSMGAAMAVVVTGLTAASASASESRVAASTNMSRTAAMNYTGPEKNLYACAKKQGGQVNFYTSETDSDTIIAPAFEKAYPGIHVNVTLATATLIPTIEQEYAAGQHVLDVYGDSNGLARDGTYFATFKSPDAKNLRTGLVSPYFLGYSGYVEAVAYNKTLIKPGTITSNWNSLLSPSLKGQLYFSTDSASPFLVGMLKAKFGMSYLQKLAANVRVSGGNGSAVASQIAAGTIGGAINEATAYTARPGFQNNAYTAQVMNPMLAGYFLASIAKSAPHPCASRLLVDWLASSKGGVPINLKLGNASPLNTGNLTNFPPPGSPPQSTWKITAMTDPALYKGYSSQAAAVADWNKIFQNLFVQGG
jgi:iron(III) transport system substrate-binding protein